MCSPAQTAELALAAIALGTPHATPRGGDGAVLNFSFQFSGFPIFSFFLLPSAYFFYDRDP